MSHFFFLLIERADILFVGHIRLGNQRFVLCCHAADTFMGIQVSVQPGDPPVGKTLIPSRLSVGSANTPSLTEKDTHGIFTARGVSWSCSRLMSSASEMKRLSCIVPSAAASLILSSISRWMSSRVSLIVHARCVVRSVSRGLGGKNQKSLHPPILKKYTVRRVELNRQVGELKKSRSREVLKILLRSDREKDN